MDILRNRFNWYWQDFEFQVLFCEHDRHGYTPATHAHEDFYELVVVREGHASHCFYGSWSRIAGGNVFLLQPGEAHSYADARKLGIYNILFSRRFFAGLLSEFRGAAEIKRYLGLDVPPGASRNLEIHYLDTPFFLQIIALLDEILEEEANNLAGARFMVLGNALKVLLLLCRYARDSVNTPPVNTAGKIGMLMKKLNTRYAEAWTLEKMAQETGFSVSCFRQQFKQLTGISPMAWLLSLRLEKAALLLTSENAGIGEIAGRCGFEDSNYFSRQFRRKFACPPRAYRAGAN